MSGASVKVSVIMPSLNVVDYIDECMQSVIGQTLKDIEILAIDAGSTDGTEEKLLQYAKSDARVNYIHSEIKSYGYQVNLGLKMAKGKYVAIVETDDYIDERMYEELFRIAEEENAEIVKADYDYFYISKTGKEFRGKTDLFFGENVELYNKIINPSMNAYLYVFDCFIWKGLYRRDFIIDNQIFLNESKGAAYQDVGFSHLVHAACRKAYYTDKSFYRYRVDRFESSVNSDKGLIYDKNEFERLMNEPQLKSRLVCKEGYYLHIKTVYIDEINRALRRENYNTNSEKIRPYYEWFRNVFMEIVNDRELCHKIRFHEIAEVVYDFDSYAKRLKNSDEGLNKLRSYYIEKSSEGAVIFGAGKKGQRMIDFLHNRYVDVEILAVCDNNDKLWGTEIKGITVSSPEECIKKYGNKTFIVANLHHKIDIIIQLVEAGIDKDMIIDSL